MTLLLESQNYRFDGGQAFLLKGDWAATPEKGPQFLEGPCREDRIEDIPVRDPGPYQLFLFDTAILTGSVRRKFLQLLPWDAGFTRENLDRGELRVRVPAEDVFEIVFSKEGKPAASERITLHLEMRSLTFMTDEEGAIATLGDPRDLILAVEDGFAPAISPIRTAMQ